MWPVVLRPLIPPLYSSTLSKIRHRTDTIQCITVHTAVLRPYVNLAVATSLLLLPLFCSEASQLTTRLYTLYVRAGTAFPATELAGASLQDFRDWKRTAMTAIFTTKRAKGLILFRMVTGVIGFKWRHHPNCHLTSALISIGMEASFTRVVNHERNTPELVDGVRVYIKSSRIFDSYALLFYISFCQTSYSIDDGQKITSSYSPSPVFDEDVDNTIIVSPLKEPYFEYHTPPTPPTPLPPSPGPDPFILTEDLLPLLLPAHPLGI